MINAVFKFLERHSSLIITTHDNADADGIGAEMVFAQIAKGQGKQVRIINSGPVPDNFQFMDPHNTIECWDKAQKSLPVKNAIVMLDTSDEYNIGKLKELIPKAKEVLVIDHHEPNPLCKFKGYIDNGASSTCELVVELAKKAGVKLSAENASAAYSGIVYDTGYFAYSKTTSRTFKAALLLVKAGVKPYEIYRRLNENGSSGSLLLQKQIFSTLEIYNQGRVASQILRKEDLEKCGARYEDAENIVNFPLRSKEIEVSIFIKENKDGKIRCSLRSKGNVNVSKIAQSLGGGGHVSASGFKSPHNPEDTLKIILEKITEEMNKVIETEKT